jgi:hypothetical protein
MSVSIYHRNDSNLDVRYDEVDANTAYLGLAAIDSNISQPVWQIKKLDFTTGVIMLWADGNSNFDNVWNDRATITYTRGT